MIKRTFGKLGWEVGAIGFGAWGIGGSWGPVERDDALAAIQTAYEAGVNFFDTADAYGEPPGVSEQFIGEALKPIRSDVLIATKVGNFARRHGHSLSYAIPEHVELCCDASLGRMKIDMIDLYQCHLANLTEPDVFLEAFDRLLEKGKIRAFGISTNSLDVVKAFNRDGKCAAVQLDYSYLHREAESDVLPYCQENQIATIIRGPLAMGIATGKYDQNTTFSDWPRQRFNEGDGREEFLRRVKIVQSLRDTLETGDQNLAQAALRFVISHPAVTVAIPGAKNPQQARANTDAGTRLLDEAHMQAIRAATSV